VHAAFLRERLRGADRSRSFFRHCLRGILAAAFAIVPAAAALASPKAVVPEPAFDFGRVRQGQKIVHEFRIRNAGDAPLEFTGARMSLREMTCRIPPRVAPGEEASIAVEWETAHLQGKVRGRATLLTNDPASPEIALVLEGEIHGALDVDPLPAIFLSVYRGEDVRRELTLTSNEPRPVELRLESAPGAHFRASLETVEKGKKWRATVRAEPGTAPGRYEETLRLASDDPAIGRVRIPVHLFVKADLYANPEAFDFGAVPLDRVRKDPALLSLLRQGIFVKKRRGTFRLRGVRSDVAALDLKTTPSSGESGSFEIFAGLRADALRPGSLDGTVTIETDDPEFPVLKIPVRGRIVEK